MRPLLHIGYHKTGTTWLQKRVFPDESAGFSYVGDPRAVLRNFFPPNPFDFDPAVARRRFRGRVDAAEARGLVPVISHERISGSPYAGGHDSRTTADRLGVVFPKARVLVTVREQADMILSVYKQYVQWGGAASLPKFLSPPPGVNRLPVFRHAFYEYHHLIGYYRDLFGDENVLVLPYELLRSRPGEFLESIDDFLGIPAAEPVLDRANVSLSALSLALKRRANRFFVRDGLNPAPFFDVGRANKILSRACRRLDEVVPSDLLKRHDLRWRRFVEREVGDRYAESNAITARMTGIDLGAFGYA